MSAQDDKLQMPPCLKGFEHIKRYWDNRYNSYIAKILPGEYYVTKQDEAISTVLGSCVSVCIWDARSGVGGMNHFMLPENNNEILADSIINGEVARYGNHAIEMLINDILKNGGIRKRLESKIIGGGKIIKNMEHMNIGELNVDFARQYMHIENILVVAEDTDDIYPRKVLYYPASGRVKVKKLRDMHNDTVLKRERIYSEKISSTPPQGDIELF